MKFILISEASKLTGLSRQKIRNWMDKGIIPHQKINDTFYVDEDTFMSLAENMRAADEAKKKLEALTAKFDAERQMFEKERETARTKHNVYRWLSVCTNYGVRTNFFSTIVEIMRINGALKDNEAEVLTQLLNGTSFEEVSYNYNTSRERIRQIAEKAMRKGFDLDWLKNLISSDKDREIEDLKDEVKVLKKMVYKQAIDITEAELGETERKLVRMSTSELNELLNSKLTNYDLSVRALNILMVIGCKTLGDLCRLNKSTFMNARNSGKKTTSEVTAFLEGKGLAWGLDIDSVLKLKL